MPGEPINSIETEPLIDALPCGVLQLDQANRVIRWNQRLERWTGRKSAEVCGRSLTEIYPGLPRLEHLLAEVRLNRQPRVLSQMLHQWFIPVPLPAHHISGFSEMQQECHVTPLEEPTGHLVITLLDVTASVVGQQRHRQQQADLVAARDRAERAFQDLVSHQFAIDQHAIVVVTDPHGVITYVNDKFCEISGFERPELIGQTHSIVHSGIHPPEFFRQLWNTISNGEVWHGEICNRTKAGKLYWESMTIVPLGTADGKPARYIAIRNDITAFRETQDALDHERFLLRALLDQVPDYVYFKDLSSRYLRISRSKALTHKLANPADAIGHSDADYFTAEHAKQALADEQEVIRTGKPLTKEEKLVWADRSVTWVSTSKIPLRNEAGRVIGTFGISRDITQQKISEITLRAAKEAAELGNRVKDEFLATMSHEIRTPLNGIIGYTELLADTALDDKQRGFLDILKNSSQSLLAILNGILDYTKIETGQALIQIVECDAGKILEECASAYAEHAKGRGLALNINIQLSNSRLVRADAGRFRQVVDHLLSNAIKFTDQGQISITVAPSTHGGISEIRVQVTDTGIGIPRDKHERIFQRFTQLTMPGTSTRGGIGLGLALSKRLVTLMGGRIGFNSERGGGTTFWFTLPAVVAPPKTAVPPPSAVPPSGSGQALQILVVEDNLLNQQLAKHHLTRLGCEVTVAGGGVTALNLVQHVHYDLIFMDCMMPEMDGYETTKAIRRWEQAHPERPRTPIIALTANAMPGDREICLQAGMDDYLTKPIIANRLAEMIAKWRPIRKT